MINVIVHEMKDMKGSFLLDGFPRTRVQAEKLDKVQPIDCVLNLIVPYDIIIGEYISSSCLATTLENFIHRACKATLRPFAERQSLQSWF